MESFLRSLAFSISSGFLIIAFVVALFRLLPKLRKEKPKFYRYFFSVGEWTFIIGLVNVASYVAYSPGEKVQITLRGIATGLCMILLGMLIKKISRERIQKNLK